MKRKAQCCCGSCEIEVFDEPILYGICNCNNCKKRTGSAFGLSAYFDKKQFSILSETSMSYQLENEQGKQNRHFCKNCGTTLFWYADVFKDFVGVAGGCFVERPLPAPSFISMNENQCGWLSFDSNIKIGFGLEDIPKISD